MTDLSFLSTIPWQLPASIASVTLALVVLFGWLVHGRSRSLRGQTVLITGAAHGVGLALAEEFCRHGCHLVLWDVNEESLKTAVKSLTSLSRRVASSLCRGDSCPAPASVFHAAVDVSDREAVYAAAQTTLDKCGGHVSILVNNAGIVRGAQPLLEHDDAHIQQTVDVNLMSHFWMCKAFLPSMRAARSGHIVSVSSVMGKLPAWALSAYCASKHAVCGFHNSLQLELSKDSASNVHATLVCPYVINTGMFDGAEFSLQWLFPVLTAEGVAKRVVRAVRSRERQVVIPEHARLAIWLMQTLPWCVCEVILRLCGAYSGMEGLVKKEQ